MKICLLIPFLFCLNASAQFDYKAINSYGSLSDIFYHEGKIYAVPIGSSTIIEVDKVTEEINTYNIYNDFPMRWKRSILKVDSFLIVINHDELVSEFRGFLSFNMNSKAYTFLANDAVLSHYGAGDKNIVFYRDYANDDHNIYLALQGGVFDKYAVMSYNPNTGLDSLNLELLPREADEQIMRLRKMGSKFCAYTTLNRFIIWEADDPADNQLVYLSEKDNVYFRNTYQDVCYFSARESLGSNDYDSVYTINGAGEIENFSAIIGAPNKIPNKLKFVDDSVCLVYSHTQILIHDLTTGVSSSITKASHDLPMDPLNLEIDPEDKGLWVVTSNTTLNEYVKTLHHIGRDDIKKDYETNPEYFVSYGAWYYPWINQNNAHIYLRLRSYYIFDGKTYHQYPIEHPWFTESNINGVDNHYPLTEGEDADGNVYCSYGFSYYAWQNKDDTTFYMKINTDHSHEFIDKTSFDLVVEQQTLSLGEYSFQITAGLLEIYNEELELEDIVIDDSITHIHGWENRVLFTSLERVYLMNIETLEYEVLIDEITSYGPYRLSNDRLGNLYYNKSGLKKIPFYKDTVLAIIQPDSINMQGNWLKHDWDGNIYAMKTGKSNEWPFENYGYIIHNNGFNWDLSNKILTNLTYRPGYYDLITGTRATKRFLYTYHSVVEIECPCRTIDEINDLYGIKSSTDSVNLTLGNDFEEALWDDGSTGSERTINAPGKYWVKVLNSKGCTNFKEFEVEISPTHNYQNETIFYYSNGNSFPLILDEALKGDLYIFDLKGALVKQFNDYQNDWVPEQELTHSMMVFAIYDGDNLLHSGRIFFL